MDRRRKTRPSLHAGILFLLLAVSRLAISTFTNDFSGYPSGAQNCLYDAADQSNCQGDTSQDMNSCLCGNGGHFVTNAGTCIAQADSGDMRSTWEIMSSHCQDSGTPLNVSEDDFLALVSSVSSTTQATSTQISSPTSTGTSSPTPTPDSDSDGQGGLSTGAKIGIIAGAAVAAVILLLAGIYFFIRRRKQRRQYEEVRPMQSSHPSPSHLANATGNANTGPSYASAVPSELESTESTVGSPSLRQTWQSSWTGSHIPWSTSELNAGKENSLLGNPRQSSHVYEMSAESEVPVSVSPTSMPVEMPTISVISPTVSPTSPHTGASWDTGTSTEHKRYEPYRPR